MRVEPKSIPWRELCCKLKDFPMRVELVFFGEYNNIMVSLFV